MGAKFPRNESSRERKLAIIFVPGSERLGHFPQGSKGSRKQNGQGANGPGSKRAKERKGQGANWPGPIGQFAPGSELVRERKGSVPISTDIGKKR